MCVLVYMYCMHVRVLSLHMQAKVEAMAAVLEKSEHRIHQMEQQGKARLEGLTSTASQVKITKNTTICFSRHPNLGYVQTIGGKLRNCHVSVASEVTLQLKLPLLCCA